MMSKPADEVTIHSRTGHPSARPVEHPEGRPAHILLDVHPAGWAPEFQLPSQWMTIFGCLQNQRNGSCIHRFQSGGNSNIISGYLRWETGSAGGAKAQDCCPASRIMRPVLGDPLVDIIQGIQVTMSDHWLRMAPYEKSWPWHGILRCRVHGIWHFRSWKERADTWEAIPGGIYSRVKDGTSPLWEGGTKPPPGLANFFF